MPDPYLVDLQKLWVERRVGKKTKAILSDVDLRIERGDIHGIIGLSGAGKTTLLRCIAGLEKPSRGALFLGGQDLFTAPQKQMRFLRRKMGVIFQHYHLFPSQNVFENIAFPMRIHGCCSKQIRKRVEELLALVGLSGRGLSYPGVLSGGEKQRVCIARALALQPLVLLCDEPTSALDAKSTSSLLHLLQSLNREMELTIIVITHEMDVIKKIAHRVAVIEKGKVIEEGLVTDIFTRPKTAVTRDLLKKTGHDIPVHFFERLDSKSRIYRLSFQGPTTAKPVIWRLFRRHPVEINILLGGIDCLGATLVGNLVVEIRGDAQDMDKAMCDLRDEGVFYEEVRP